MLLLAVCLEETFINLQVRWILSTCRGHIVELQPKEQIAGMGGVCLTSISSSTSCSTLAWPAVMAAANLQLTTHLVHTNSDAISGSLCGCVASGQFMHPQKIMGVLNTNCSAKANLALHKHSLPSAGKQQSCYIVKASSLPLRLMCCRAPVQAVHQHI